MDYITNSDPDPDSDSDVSSNLRPSTLTLQNIKTKTKMILGKSVDKMRQILGIPHTIM